MLLVCNLNYRNRLLESHIKDVKILNVNRFILKEKHTV